MQQSQAPDITTLIEELDQRVDRLRALYEQYFMGFERLEPMVQRKDVDRRLNELQKMQIRNTAQRFKFNMIRQRVVTYRAHWQRILRQIEAGTYKRHVQKAQKRFGPEAARLERRRKAEEAAAAERREQEAQEAAERATKDLEDDSAAAMKSDKAADSKPAHHRLDVDDPFAGFGDEPPSRVGLDAEILATRRDSGEMRAVRAREHHERAVSLQPKPPVPARPMIRKRGEPQPESKRALPSLKPPGAREPVIREARPKPVLPSLHPPEARNRFVRNAPSGPSIRPKAESSPRIESDEPARPESDRPLRPVSDKRDYVRRPTPPPQQAAALAKPMAETQIALEQAKKERMKPKPRVAASGASGDELPERRVREIYRDYVLARIRKNEPTSTVTYDAVAKQLQASRRQLKRKHGKDVDFEVVEKDGQTILKPVIR